MARITNAMSRAAFSPIKHGAYTGFTFARGIFDGAMGKTSFNGFSRTMRDTSSGLEKRVGGAGKLHRSVKANSKRAWSGRKYERATMLAGDEGSRIGGALHVVSDVTFGTAGLLLGWGARGVGATALGIGKVATSPIGRRAAHLTGGVAYEGAAGLVQATVGAANIARKVGRNEIGAGAMFGGGIAITGGAMLAGALLDEGKKDFTGYASELPGTTAASQYLVDTGADGALSLALHKLR